MSDSPRHWLLMLLISIGGPFFAPLVVADLAPDPAISQIVEGIDADALLSHVETLVEFRTRRWDQPEGLSAQNYIEAFFAELTFDEVYRHDFDAGSDTIVAVVRGRESPTRMHVLGAHYDSICYDDPRADAPGADDNASGTAALLEIARAISESSLRPRETIAFIAFSGEEHGRKGSRAFVADIAQGSDQVVDMIALDAIGYLEPGTEADLSVSSAEFTPAIVSLIATLEAIAALYLPTWRFEGGPGCG